MPGFSTGLIEGLAGGMADQWNKKAQAETAERKQKLDDYLRVAENGNMPDDTRQRAWDQAQEILGGGKKGKKGGDTNPILDRLRGLVFGQQGGQDGQGGQQPQAGSAYEAQKQGPLEPGTTLPAPGQGAIQRPPQPPTAIDPQTGRPTLRRPDGLADVVPQPQAGAPQGQQAAPQGNPLDAQIEQAQRLLSAIPPGQSFARQRAQQRLDELTAEKTKAEMGDYYKAHEQDRAETGRESLEQLKATATAERQDMIDRHKTELAKAAQQGKEALEHARAQHAKELKELADKDAAELKKYIQAHAPKKPASATKPNVADPQKAFTKIEEQKTVAYQQAATKLNNDIEAIKRNTGLSPTQKDDLIETAKARYAQQEQVIQQVYRDRIRRAGGSTDGAGAKKSGGASLSGSASGGTVQMKSPDGTVKPVPRDQVDHFKSLGAVVVQ